MRATALPALGKMVGHSLKGKLVVILWNQGRHRVSGSRVSLREIHVVRAGCEAEDRTISISN